MIGCSLFELTFKLFRAGETPARQPAGRRRYKDKKLGAKS
jgi:hypothetical protein